MSVVACGPIAVGDNRRRFFTLWDSCLMDAKSADERRVETLIAQLSRIQTAHGPIPAAFVHDENGPPLDNCLPGKPLWYYPVGHGELIYLWPTFGADGESIGLKLFDGVCRGLETLAGERSHALPTSLTQWVSGLDARDRWLMLLFGLSVENVTHHVQRCVRKCWTAEGNTVTVGSLDVARKMLPHGFNGKLPENEDSWFVRIDDVLQTSINAVEYLCELPLPDVTEGPTHIRSNQGNTAAGVDAEPSAPIEQLQPAHRNAYLAFQYAAAKLERTPESLQDREAWDYIDEYGIEGADELDEYKLPLFDAFTTYLTRVRSKLGEQKKRPKTVRGGRSTPKQSEI